jgi:signal transduction histidine kinase
MLHVYYLLLLLAIVLIFAVFLYISRKRLKRTNAMLETSYNVLEMSNDELLEANQELIKANARAEESSKMKTNFIQQISHEIRTPLNILSGFTQLITSPDIELDKEELDNINKGIVENTERITRLVNKMLELSDASSCAVIGRNDAVPALQVAVEAIDAIGFANPQGFDFDFQFSPDAETVTLQTDLRSAVRALTLILGNARKFVAKDRPLKIVLRLSVVDDKVEYSVEDNGIGVPPEESEHIFEEFVQLDEFYEGTGIGLTVARSIARRLGGNIVLDTTYSPGARFVFSLPINH